MGFLSQKNLMINQYKWQFCLKNKSIILMNYQNNQEDECFVSTQVQEHEVIEQSENGIQFDQDIRNSLPKANQLKPHYRPSTMIPRVMNTQPDIYALPQPLNQPCQEIILETTTSNSRPKLGNKQKLELAQYLHKKQFYIVYNKHSESLLVSKKATVNNLTIRLRTISQLSDYDWKLFKQINNQQIKTRRSFDTIDSNFQCGNLSRVYANYNNPNGYYLLLEQDVNTHGYTNWFFFRFRNQEKGMRKFYILNMAKRTSFYKQGMKISTFSMNKFAQNNLRWHKAGDNISFFQTNFLKNAQTNQYFNCLYFQYEFQYEHDEVYFALSQPYTYTRMANMIKQINVISQSQQIQIKTNVNVQTVGYSISNNIIPSITISNTFQSATKKTIIILGRQHPSQMAGSFISQYLLKFLTKKTEQTSLLLNKFNFVFIPMVNPDGVIYGNSRSNLAGLDLNRHWGPDAIKQLTPETFKIRSALCSVQKSQQNIKFLLDLHGHGKKINSFLFCCKKQDRISNRYFPLIMSKIETRFDLVSCTYGISKDKQNTVRAQLYDIGINNCYTLQNSYYGYYKTKGLSEVKSYTEKDYQQIASSIIKSLYVFFSSEKSQLQSVKTKFGYNIQTINEELIKIVDKLQRQEKNNANDQDIMSQSDPQGDGLKLQERLKICNNSKVLDKKIRQSYKKNKNCSKQKNQKQSKKAKIKTQPVEPQKQQSSEQDIKILQKKIESKLILSKKLKTQNKMRATTRQRKSMMDTRKSFEQQQSKLIKKVINQPLQTGTPVLNSKLTNCYYMTQKHGSFVARTKPYDRSKIYQKIKTQISQTHSFSMQDIQQQNLRKEKIQQQFSKLKNQSLKNMMKQSLLFLGHSLRNKKCVQTQQKQKKVRASNHLIQAKFHSFSFNLDDNKLPLRTQKSQSDLSEKIKIMPTPYDPSQIRSRSYSKKDSEKRSYHRFQSFVKNEPFHKNMLKDNKGPVFYHFPVM